MRGGLASLVGCQASATHFQAGGPPCAISGHFDGTVVRGSLVAVGLGKTSLYHTGVLRDLAASSALRIASPTGIRLLEPQTQLWAAASDRSVPEFS